MEAGCALTLTKDECVVRYNDAIILQGKKDPTTNLYALLLGTPGMTSQHVTSVLPLATPVVANTNAHSATEIAFFTHTV
jgi:hypothetical protein